MTILHIILAFARWYSSHSDNYWAYLWGKIIHYAPVEVAILVVNNIQVSWKNPNFLWATDRLLKTLPLFLLMMLSALPFIRRVAWELFFYLHQIVILLMLVMFVYHSRNLVYYATIPFILYGMDKLMRWLSIYTKHCTVAEIQAFEDMVYLDVDVRNMFDNAINYPNLIGSTVYLRIPKVKLFEYHPISLAFNKGNHLYFYIKVVGNKRSWSHKLAQLSGQKGLRAYVEGPYTMMRHENEVKMEKGETIMKHYYGDNTVIVSGGAGFAGVSSYLTDYIEMVSLLPPEKQVTKHLYVIVVVPHHRHLECMSELLLKCKKLPCCHMELYVTYRNHPELKEKNLHEVACRTGDLEVEDKLEYSVGRPDLSAFFNNLDADELNVYYCGPKPLEKILYKSLLEQKHHFYFYPEVFDMCIVCKKQNNRVDFHRLLVERRLLLPSDSPPCHSQLS